MPDKQHWDQVYRSRAAESVSWFQARAALSLALIARCAPAADDPIVDIGGGASVLVDALLDAGHTRLHVLDLAGPALAASRQRLGPRAAEVQWLEADITDPAAPIPDCRIWHDRAVFHFMTTPAQQQGYRRKLAAHLLPGGHAVIATFAAHGPERCSGLPVQRYGIDTLAEAFRDELELLDSAEENHVTPGGGSQAFIYGRFRRR